MLGVIWLIWLFWLFQSAARRTGGVAELHPDAVDAAGAVGAGGAVLGRPGDERGRGAVGPAPGGVADGTRREADRGYELPVGRRFVGTLRVGVGTSADGRDYRLGYGLEQHPLQLFHERSTRFRKEQ